MLAEARQRKKWSIDPRNSAWSNDDQRYGVKMLEKMGWNKGKGLGMNEDGGTSHVKVSHKADNRGLGCSLSYENNWVAHQDDFSSLLNQLNTDHDKQQENKPNSNLNVADLETQSKSQKVLHYQKFSKGKNLALYKQEDMSAIFGCPIKTTTTECNNRKLKKKIDHKEKVPKHEVKIPHKRKSETETEGFTVKSEYNIQEYFKMRKAEIARSKSENIIAKKSAPIETASFDPNMDVDNYGNGKKSDKNKTKIYKVKKKKRKKVHSKVDQNSISHKKIDNADDIG
uniref:PIN2/TERF1-interacting telomerase inhibitor 1-like n=1 Tax=Phallusia mammillata TaxID=59560 RepID=A0A6F9DP27_9ASCI|nr:PIN2/TERF1-interacting telomerase inhibitor 1-like [Phallusia mammillata]